MISMKEAKEILKPYEASILASKIHGFQKFHDHESSMFHILQSKERSQVLNAFISSEAEFRLKEKSGVEIIEENNTRLFVFKSRILIRFKKLGPGLLTHNNETNLSKSLKSQRDLPIEGSHFMIAGYQVKELWDGLSMCVLTLPSSDSKNHWHYQLEPDYETVEMFDPLEGETAAKSPKELDITPFGKRVRVKGAKSNDEERESSND